MKKLKVPSIKNNYKRQIRTFTVLTIYYGPEVLIHWYIYPPKFDSWGKEEVIHKNGNR